ncbi:sugar phosphate isomerase/epimerase family protein [Vagococcus elongatus]|uniref:Xylose isomerase-like TIM barrel domain-containing protein n=1 Tax=Vagococcus elongatus TaxID=180344 RepID=A0A430APE3_9ENTE|nr:TIM barrel protein [Vagococcus elongatus]RSU09969.1 hypothetical protein CBF29_10350 [Vagococcus elongatus]
MKNLVMDQLAAMSVQYSKFSFDYFINSMEECGIKNVELWAGVPHYWRENYLSSSDAIKKIREYRRRLEDKGMKVIMYTPETLVYPFNPAAKNINTRNRTIDLFKMAVEDALEFGTNQVFCNSGSGLYDEEREYAWERMVDTFQQVTSYAKKMGVDLNIEQLQRYESNLVCTAHDIRRVIKEVDASNMYCCLDVVAMAEAGESIDGFYEIIGKESIQHVHFSDRNHEIPGDRDLPLKEYLEYLDELNYSGYISLEVNDIIYLEKPHEAFYKSTRKMNELLEK